MRSDVDPELAAEQSYVDDAYECLARMRERAEALVGQSEDPDLEAALEHRVAVLTDGGRALCFGRIDGPGQSWHIGRRHVEDDASDPVVVEWRAPVAVPFYRATLSDPMNLTRRRQFVADRQTILSIADDLFGPEAARVEGPRVRGRDALLAELDRSRAGEMFDIVATIQAEQDEAIRAPLEGVLVVQGGPGTGKTAIGLHRAAYLLYAHPPLARSGVLVIGPNRTFLRYIAQVLPSLGEEAVVQTTLADLVPALRVRAEDSLEAQRVKGDAVMVPVLRAALASNRRMLEEALEVRVGRRRLVLTPEDAEEAVAAVAARRVPYQAGRAALRDRLLRLMHERHVAGAGRLGTPEPSSVSSSVRRDPGFKGALDRLWPSVSPPALVREVVSNPAVLARAARGLMGQRDQEAISRPPSSSVGREPWSDADVALVDEAREILSGPARTYGHVVVDEAQDLSPMQIRMLARRCPGGSVTVLGDLAQGTGVWAHDSWEEVVAHLPTPRGWRSRELATGYRAPGQVLDMASRLLPVAAPGVRATQSVRPGRSTPSLISVGSDALVAAACAEAARLAGLYHSVGLVVPRSLERRAALELGKLGADHGVASRDGLSHAVTVLSAPETRGLEFDAAVVVEPSRLVQDAPRGLRLLYVAMTRPLQHLSLVSSEPLPEPLADGAQSISMPG